MRYAYTYVLCTILTNPRNRVCVKRHCCCYQSRRSSTLSAHVASCLAHYRKPNARVMKRREALQARWEITGGRGRGLGGGVHYPLTKSLPGVPAASSSLEMRGVLPQQRYLFPPEHGTAERHKSNIRFQSVNTLLAIKKHNKTIFNKTHSSCGCFKVDVSWCHWSSSIVLLSSTE